MKELIQKGKRRGPARLIAYGQPKIGKSTFASGAPKPIFVTTEDGLEEIECDSFPLATSYDAFMTNLNWLASDGNADEYKSVVIDSLDWLEKLIHAKTAQQQRKPNFASIPYGKGPELAMEFWNEFIAAMNYLRDVKGKNIICIAHSKVTKVNNPEGDSYDRYDLALDKLAAARLTEWAYAVGFATVQQRAETIGDGFNKRTVMRPVGADGGERVLRLTGSPACNAGNRYGIVGEIPLSWDAFAEAIAS